MMVSNAKFGLRCSFTQWAWCQGCWSRKTCSHAKGCVAVSKKNLPTKLVLGLHEHIQCNITGKKKVACVQKPVLLSITKENNMLRKFEEASEEM